MQFKYTATNPEGKKLTGVINADDENGAREKLNAMGFSILSIEQSAEPIKEQTADLKKFEFEATDKNGKKIKGTVPAKDDLAAYTRLISEYHFTINYLASVDDSPEQKENRRGPGLEELKKKFELGTEGKVQQEEMQSVIESPEFMAEKNQLVKQVDDIITKTKQMLAQFQGKISPEMQAKINNNLDKLLRIKSSNNLDYIRNTSKDLIDQLQKDEIFLKTQTHDEERQKIMLESQQMMAGLKGPGIGSTDVGAQVKEGLAKAEKKLKGTKWEFLLNPIKFIQEKTKGDPEIQALKFELKTLHSKKWNAIKMAIKAPKEIRKTNWESVKEIQKEERKTKSKLHTLKKMKHDQGADTRAEHRLYVVEEISTFTGWLLFFYLTYYFLGHYVTMRGLGLHPFLGIPFDLSDSVLFKYLLTIIFLIHAAASLKINFFYKNKIASIILVGSVILLSLLTLFNF